MSSATCLICSEEWEVNHARENTHLYCRECRKPSERSIDYGHADPCIPWNGEFDEDDNPMRFGELHLPGQRRCKHKDCVQKSHIQTEVTAQDLLAEQFSIYYRTKKHRSYDQLMLALQKEQKVRAL